MKPLPGYVAKVAALSVTLLPMAAACLAAPGLIDPEPVLEACAGAAQPERNGWLQGAFFGLAVVITLVWARLADRMVKLEGLQ